MCFYLVYEDFEFNAGIHFVGLDDGVLEFGQGLIVIVLGIDDEDQRATIAEDHVRVEGGIDEIDLTRKIPDRKLHKTGIIDVVLDDLRGGLEEECFIRRHFMEDHLLYGTFAGTSQTHQQDAWLHIDDGAVQQTTGVHSLLRIDAITIILGERIHMKIIVHLVILQTIRSFAAKMVDAQR